MIPEKHRKPMIESVEKTKQGTAMVVIIAIAYG
jgi:undecaprenyl pyrophosphate synthase